MGVLSSALNIVGLVLLAHAAYSSYEHSLLTDHLASNSNPKATASVLPSVTSLPLDIVIEALLSTTLLLLGIVIGAPKLRPINWAEWANEAEQDTRRPANKRRFQGDGGAEGRNMSWLENRQGFLDIRGKRKEFADWVRKDGEKEKK